MEYIKVEWIHEFDDEPVVLYSEIDEARNEIRKIEIFRNGPAGHASSNVEYLATCCRKALCQRYMKLQLTGSLFPVSSPEKSLNGNGKAVSRG